MSYVYETVSFHQSEAHKEEKKLQNETVQQEKNSHIQIKKTFAEIKKPLNIHMAWHILGNFDTEWAC